MRCLMVMLAASLLLSNGCASPGSDERESAGQQAAEPSSETSHPGEVPSPASPGSSSSQAAEATSGTRVIIDDSDFGPMLYSAKGQAIYLFDLEKSSRPQCYAECAIEWPPVLTTDKPVAGRGVRPGLLSTVERRDGSTQVTYAGHPLYYYAHEGLNEVLCHDFFEFGGTWYVVQPSGEPAP